MLKLVGCLSQDHDTGLLILAAVMCLIACFTTVQLLWRAKAHPQHGRRWWALGAGFVCGSGVWSMHFIALLAIRSSLPMTYDLTTTLASAIIPIAGACFAVRVCINGDTIGSRIAGGIFIGMVVCTMHFIGMEALRLPGSLSYNLPTVAVGIVVCIALSTIGIVRAGGLRTIGQRFQAATTLASAVFAVHFFSMAGMTIVPGMPALPTGLMLAPQPLAVVVAGVSATILVISLAGSALDQHLMNRSAIETARLRRFADNAFEAILIHRNGRIIDVNEAACHLVGRLRVDLLDRNVLDFVAPTSVAKARERLADRNRFDQPQAPCELSIIGAAGQPVEVDLLARPIDYEGLPAVVVAVRDLTERKQAEERMRYLAHHDPLTGLANRLLVQTRLADAMEEAQRTGENLAVLCMDLDRFKLINDTLGHDAGDRLLLQVAERMRKCVRDVDTLARAGGDEFKVVAVRLGSTAIAAQIAQRVVHQIAQPFEIDGQLVLIGVSIGIAMIPEDGTDVPTVLRNADTALYRAKNEGGGSYRFFEQAMDRRVQERRLMERDLRSAISGNEMVLHYQPIVHADTGVVESHEALLRWTHRTLGPISPGEFIPIAEQTGVILELGAWALRSACEAASTWPDGMKVSVNLSPVQFRHPDLPGLVRGILADTGLDGSRLELEVTESLLIEDTGRASAILRALRQLGIRIALDDFGTGYASLDCLRRFRFDRIKLDRNFICEMDRDDGSTVIVGAVIDLAHTLGVSVIAEGVETMAQLRILQDRDCDLVQGYLIGRPAAEVLIRTLPIDLKRPPISAVSVQSA